MTLPQRQALHKGFQFTSAMVGVSEVGEMFRCDICGNIVEVKEVGGGELVCCGEAMIKE